MRITREQAVKEVGEELVAKVESENLDFTNRVTDGTDHAGFTEFSASIEAGQSNLVMYVLVDTDTVDSVDRLDEIDWDKEIKDAEFEII